MSTPSASSHRSDRSVASNDTAGPGIVLGLLPLLLLVLLVAATLALSAFVRQQVAPSGFFVQRNATLITLIGGLIISLLVYGSSIILVFRRVITHGSLKFLGIK